jgi:chromosome segregation ATPase
VRRSGEGQEPHHQGHLGGQPRAFAEEHLPGDAHQGLNDELMMTYHNRDFKTDDLDDTRTRLQHAPDELTAAQSYIHHLMTELHKRDEQLKASQVQAADLQYEVEHLQELIPPEPKKPEEDREEIEGMSSVDDD